MVFLADILIALDPVSRHRPVKANAGGAGNGVEGLEDLIGVGRLDERKGDVFQAAQQWRL